MPNLYGLTGEVRMYKVISNCRIPIISRGLSDARPVSIDQKSVLMPVDSDNGLLLADGKKLGFIHGRQAKLI